MVIINYTPQKGDVVWLSFDPTRGREQKGHRPALVISETVYNISSGMMICCPITSKGKGFEVHVPLKGKLVNGFILCDHLRSVDWYVRRPQFVEKVSVEVLVNVQNIIASLIL